MFGATIFLSAFLLFLIQPLIGKQILPQFGGGTSVWTACLLFFQLGLLAGYGYAHFLNRLPPRRQAVIHTSLLVLMLVAIPFSPWRPGAVDPAAAPAWSIMRFLFSSIGLPFVVLSSSSPLIQAWHSRMNHLVPPYSLYSLSNFGSLLALLSYPFILAPLFTLSTQRLYWSLGCVLLALLWGYGAARFGRLGSPGTEDPRAVHPGVGDGPHPPPTRRLDRILWFSLSACGATMLMASTNFICQDTAVVPLLWILPLSLYLLSYIICFHSPRWYARSWFALAFAASAVLVCVVLYRGVTTPIALQIASFCFSLFTSCMVCHGELFRLRPDPRSLTAFYWLVASGGAAAGVFVTVLAPALFTGYWEFYLALAGTLLLWMVGSYRDPASFLTQGRPMWAWVCLTSAFSLLVGFMIFDARTDLEDKIEVSRNFYGVLRVLEREKDDPDRHYYVLMHGRIEHGVQFLSQQMRYWPTSYYGAESGIGMAIAMHPRRLENRQSARNLRIGVVGLGTGTLATYGEEGDYIRFYEIDPQVVRVSDEHFTYRRNTPARVEIVQGDARLSMESERSRGEAQAFDVLAIDAFNSDSIPVHLLTVESFGIYQYHLKPDGILAVHISSRYLDLSPVLRALALTHDMRAVWIADEGSQIRGTDASDWILLTRNERFLNNPAVQIAEKPWPTATPGFLLWTDDYSSILEVLK